MLMCAEYGDALADVMSSGKGVFLVAATLRPETMYGQTNCFVLPHGDYVAIDMKDNEIFITSEWGARNMAWQEMTPTQGQYHVRSRVKGWDLLGRAVQAPLTPYPKLYVLPLHTISMEKVCVCCVCVCVCMCCVCVCVSREQVL